MRYSLVRTNLLFGGVSVQTHLILHPQRCDQGFAMTLLEQFCTVITVPSDHINYGTARPYRPSVKMKVSQK
jgi:hypothetical protein